MKTLALAFALVMTVSAMSQPVYAANGSIADLMSRAAAVTSAIEDPSAAEQTAFTPFPLAQQETSAQPVSAEPEFTEGIIVGGTINVRSGPSTNCDRITQVTSGKRVTVLGKDNDWYQIQFGNTTGYVLGDYLKKYDPSTGSTVGAQIVEMAMQYMGVRYRSGGSSPNGFDCSGFTMYLYGQLGYPLPHTATGQYKNCGTYVAKEDLQPGDLVFFSDSSHAIGHVGIYIGNGEIIHARSSTGCVTTNSLSMSYYVNRYVGAKRIA